MRRWIALAAVAVLPAIAQADSYNFTVGASSTSAWNLTVNAPFVVSGDPRSFLIGNYDATANPTGTRTLVGLVGSDNGLNNVINLSAGGVSASGSSGQTPLHPAGVFSMNIDPAAGTIVMTGLSLNILNGGQAAVGAEVSLTYPSFRTRQPTCTVFGGFPITLPIGEGQITGLVASQAAEEDAGVLTPGGSGTYTFAIPFTVNLLVTATLQGEPFPVEPQSLPVVLTGTVTLDGATASMAATLDISNQQTQPGPLAMDPMPFTEPLCGGGLLLNLQLASVAVNVSTQSNLVAPGVRTCTAVSITQHPANQTVDAGDPAEFSVQASGSGTPSYQWRRGQTVLVNGGAITGATSATLRIDPSATTDAGTYTCTVTNACSTRVSAGGVLTVNDGPVCDPDYNQDGNIDQDDVRYLVGVVAGGDNPTGRDPDFNQDGNADQDDVAALINAVAGGGCP
ncbi:MAG: hypothetical protein DYG92_12695 [Leptolyngbya sp. PLA1]|nr:hypothetical protein [Leptolyngbya sp. PLA1]